MKPKKKEIVTKKETASQIGRIIIRMRRLLTKTPFGKTPNGNISDSGRVLHSFQTRKRKIC